MCETKRIDAAAINNSVFPSPLTSPPQGVHRRAFWHRSAFSRWLRGPPRCPPSSHAESTFVVFTLISWTSRPRTSVPTPSCHSTLKPWANKHVIIPTPSAQTSYPPPQHTTHGAPCHPRSTAGDGRRHIVPNSRGFSPMIRSLVLCRSADSSCSGEIPRLAGPSTCKHVYFSPLVSKHCGHTVTFPLCLACTWVHQARRSQSGRPPTCH